MCCIAGKSHYLLPRSKLLRSHHSPLLLSVRGFKTRSNWLVVSWRLPITRQTKIVFPLSRDMESVFWILSDPYPCKKKKMSDPNPSYFSEWYRMLTKFTARINPYVYLSFWSLVVLICLYENFVVVMWCFYCSCTIAGRRGGSVSVSVSLSLSVQKSFGSGALHTGYMYKVSRMICFAVLQGGRR